MRLRWKWREVEDISCSPSLSFPLSLSLSLSLPLSLLYFPHNVLYRSNGKAGSAVYPPPSPIPTTHICISLVLSPSTFVFYVKLPPSLEL